MSTRHTVSYLSLALLWGFSFLLLRHVIGAFGWVGAVAFRAFVASGLLYAVARVSRRPLTFGAWGHLVVVGATTVAGQLLGLSFAIPVIGTAMSALLVVTIPLFSMVIGQAWGIERMTGRGLVGLLLGLAGLVLLVGFPAVPITHRFLLGCAVMLAATFSAAFGSNYARRHLAEMDSWEQTIGAFLTGGLIAVPLLVVEPLRRVPTWADVGWLVLLAAACSSLTYVLYFRLVDEIGPTKAISVEFLVTLVAVLVGALVLGEPLTLAQVVGGAVVVVGCALVLGLLGRDAPEPVHG